MSQRSTVLKILCRFAIAAACGAVVAAAAYVSTYYDQRGLFSYGDLQLHTIGKLNAMEQAIQHHRNATGEFPTDLGALPAVKFYRQFTVNPKGQVVDVWDHPFQYRIDGDRFDLYSLGADGQPGGVGRDADLYPRSAGRTPGVPTLRQFTFELPTASIQRTCIAAGVCALLVCLLVTRKRRGASLLGRTAATTIVFFLAAIAATSFQAPSGR